MGRNAPTEEKRKEDDATLQIIFDYVVNNVYPEHACKNQKAKFLPLLIRKQSNYKTSYIHGTRTDVLYKNVC